MTKYRFTVTRPTTESTTVEVEAASIEAAQDKALSRAFLDAHADWQPDDGSGHNDEAYLPDPDDYEIIG